MTNSALASQTDRQKALDRVNMDQINVDPRVN
jgi:hypothetical protein